MGIVVNAAIVRKAIFLMFFTIICFRFLNENRPNLRLKRCKSKKNYLYTVNILTSFKVILCVLTLNLFAQTVMKWQPS